MNLHIIAERLKKIRKEYLKKTQKSLARDLNCSQSMISKAEAEENFSVLMLILNFYVNEYNINANWVLCENNGNMDVLRTNNSNEQSQINNFLLEDPDRLIELEFVLDDNNFSVDI